MNVRVGLCGVAVVLAVTGCSGRGLGLSDPNQVIVRLEDPRDVEGATQVAQETCRRRGQRARLIAVVNTNTSTRHRNFEQRPPDAVFTCDPVR